MSIFSRRELIGVAAVAVAVPVVGRLGSSRLLGSAAAATSETFRVNLTPAQWQKRLSPAAFSVLREEGTEVPFTSPLNNEHRRGTFDCAGCALPLYASTTKFDSGTGWPSFYAPLAHAVLTRTDTSLGIPRTEVRCQQCGGHLGHVFEDGPKPTGLRYCMNGVAMSFAPAKA